MGLHVNVWLAGLPSPHLPYLVSASRCSNCCSEPSSSRCAGPGRRTACPATKHAGTSVLQKYSALKPSYVTQSVLSSYVLQALSGESRNVALPGERDSGARSLFVLRTRLSSSGVRGAVDRSLRIARLIAASLATYWCSRYALGTVLQPPFSYLAAGPAGLGGGVDRSRSCRYNSRSENTFVCIQSYLRSSLSSQ